MGDSSEVKWLEAGCLPVDSASGPGQSFSEWDEAPEILVTDLRDLKPVDRNSRSSSNNSADNHAE